MTKKSDLLKAIRARCLDCSCYQPSEVTLCTAKGCALWPFRTGRDPNPARAHAAKNLLYRDENFQSAKSGQEDTSQARSAQNSLPVAEIFGGKRASKGKGGPMRDFSKVSPTVWQSERFNSLPSDDGRYVLPLPADQ